jgi:serine/threonine-protein kinase RsbW
MLNIDELPEGGMGINLMSQIADELTYTRISEKQNCLLIAKNYTEADTNFISGTPTNGMLEHFIDSVTGFNWLKGKNDGSGNTPVSAHKINLQVNTDLSGLAQVLEWFDQLETLQIPKAVWWKCRLALGEGFTNAVRHAHKHLPMETPITLETIVFPSRIEIRIWDYGEPFNLEEKMMKKPKSNDLSFSTFNLMDEIQSIIS